MKVGVHRDQGGGVLVALTAVGARELAEHGHEVLVQQGAGEGSAIADADYEAQGAQIVPSADAIFAEADMILGQGAAAGRGRDAAARADPVHLPAPGAGAGADDGPLRDRRDRIAYETVEDTNGACRCSRR